MDLQIKERWTFFFSLPVNQWGLKEGSILISFSKCNVEVLAGVWARREL